ncbi:hypothetical protein HDV06_002962 [Boothiomyces sp. JEL0866]|nr:hypothetical protein HDV06_002962 [Boothiomyces sp. JEL0866]
MDNFLENLCDFNVLIVGCNDYDNVRLVNTISACFHVISLVAGLIFPISRIQRQFTPQRNPNLHKDLLFWSTVMNALYHTLTIIKYLLMNIISINAGYQSILSSAKAIISLEYISLSTAGICITCFVSHIVQGALGSNETIYTLFGKEFNPMKIIRLIRLILFIFSLVVFTCWIQLGLQSHDHYVIYRRIVYYCYTAIVGFINPIVYNNFLSKIVRKLETRFKENNAEIPEALKVLTLFKNVFTTSYAAAGAVSMFTRVFGNDHFSSSILPWQIVGNLAGFYTSTVLTFYSIYRASPDNISKLRKKMSSSKDSDRKQSKNNLIPVDKTKTVFAAPTVVLSK